jgi:hypothetical protein
MVITLPFGTSSNINNSHANAITENEYYTDQYMGYANDMVKEYEDESSYASDGYGGSEQDRRSYENDNDYYEPREYPSYKPDYKKLF